MRIRIRDLLDPGFGIREKKFGSGIRNKHPRSATLLVKNVTKALHTFKFPISFFYCCQNSSLDVNCLQGGCDHICIPTGVTSRTCGCSVGFQKTPGNKQDVESRFKPTGILLYKQCSGSGSVRYILRLPGSGWHRTYSKTQEHFVCWHLGGH